MYMRLLQLKVNADKYDVLREIYDKIVIPSLQTVPGCQFASLIQSNEDPEYFFSMTLWDTHSHAENYNKSEIYQKLLELVKPILTESTEWKIHLSEDFQLEYEPTEEEPVLKEFTISEFGPRKEKIPLENPRLYVRIFSVKLQEGKIDECRHFYRKEVLPALRQTRGCQFAFLVENLHDENEVISVTIWDSKKDADAYENSGLFDELLNKVIHIFSPLYQWKMALEKDFKGRVKTSDDGILDHYSMVTARRFR